MKKLLLTLLTAVMGITAWAYTYTKVTTAPQDWSGTYVVTTEISGVVNYWTGVDAGQCHAEATMSGSKIDDCPITITVAALQEGGYSVKVNGGANDGKYISSGTSAPGYSNGLKFNATAHRVDFAMDANGCVEMSQTIGTSGTMYFLYNKNTGANNERFRFYKGTNLGGDNYQTPTLYKQDAGAGIAVTGVSLDKTSASIVVEEQITLTATVTPANADNKSVTWTSSNETVAIVSNGVVTGVSAGSATITVTTEDGNLTATCDVTVNAKPATVAGIVYKWDGTGSTSAATQNGGVASVPIESSTNMVAGNSQKGNYCFKMNKGVSSTGGPFVILITFNEPLKVGDIITGAVFRTGSSSSATFGLDFLAEGASAVPSYTLEDPQVLESNGTPEDNISFVVPESADGSNTLRLYRYAGGTGLYVSKFVVSRPADVTITSAGWATYVTPCALDFSESTVDAYSAKVNVNEVTLTPLTTVPAGEAIIVKGAEGTVKVPVAASADAIDNDLTYSNDPVDTDGTQFILAKKGEDVVFAKATGTIAAGKGYLVVPSGSASSLRVVIEGMEDGMETAISELNAAANAGAMFDLQGRRANGKGLMIQNGKVVLVK